MNEYQENIPCKELSEEEFYEALGPLRNVEATDPNHIGARESEALGFNHEPAHYAYARCVAMVDDHLGYAALGLLLDLMRRNFLRSGQVHWDAELMATTHKSSEAELEGFMAELVERGYVWRKPLAGGDCAAFSYHIMDVAE